MCGPRRVIADDVWAKLLWAGLNLIEDDLLQRHEAVRYTWNPLAMVRALVVTWCFAGLRTDELRRLRVGCMRWQHGASGARAGLGDTRYSPGGRGLPLDVPAHKTGRAFAKPVDRLVGEAIAAWEQVRPAQPPAVDPKTGEVVHFLFSSRGLPLGKGYINRTLIPRLCWKSNVPADDARGKLTSHRARAAIASQLFNAKEPMSHIELQDWLGHRSPLSTQYYARLKPTRLARAYADAGYFVRNLRTIEVLVDQDAVRSGAAANGAPWRFNDLGHGYCTYDFSDQCPHRMACAKCAFYRPKGSSAAQLLEAKANLLRLKQKIPLTDEEAAAVDDGLDALERLCAQLADVPTPAGPTPRELRTTGRLEVPVLPPNSQGGSVGLPRRAPGLPEQWADRATE